VKKKYGKPEVTFENFSLSSNIAGNCGSSLNHHSYDSCGCYTTSSDPLHGCVFVDNGFTVFTSSAICDVQPDSGWSQVCYHVVTDELKAFTS
jgi:hypothetical protein